MKLVIKNLLEPGNLQLLKNILNELNIRHEDEVVAGELVTAEDLSSARLRQLGSRLEQHSMHIITGRKEQLSERVRHIVREMLDGDAPQENYSLYIGQRLGLNYTYIANAFSFSQGATIERLIISTRIEKAKQMLLTGRYAIGQVAEQLHYSSIGHFSNQFKRVTGKNPSAFLKQA